jgi:hypothetical protein
MVLLYVILFAVLGSGFVFVLVSKAKPPQAGQGYQGYQAGAGRSTPM